MRVTGAVDDTRAEEHVDIGRGRDGVDEVLRHALLKAVTTYNQGYARRPLGEVQRGLANGVPSTDEVNATILVLLGLGGRGAIEDAEPGEAFEGRYVKPAVRDAHSEDHGARRELAAIGRS